MSKYKIRYYACEHCGRNHPVKITPERVGQVFTEVCPITLKKFTIDEGKDDPSPPTNQPNYKG